MLVAVVDGWQEIYAVSPVLEHGTEATGDLMYQLACSRFPRCRTTVEITRARVVELVRQAIAAGTRDVSLKDRVPH